MDWRKTITPSKSNDCLQIDKYLAQSRKENRLIKEVKETEHPGLEACIVYHFGNCSSLEKNK
jgi:hypothetical protein